MQKFCYKCFVVIRGNNEYLECLKCTALYCTKCIKSNQFVLNEDNLLYDFDCPFCH